MGCFAERDLSKLLDRSSPGRLVQPLVPARPAAAGAPRLAVRECNRRSGIGEFTYEPYVGGSDYSAKPVINTALILIAPRQSGLADAHYLNNTTRSSG